MAQIIRITSEALQATIRRLLPSQQGFGEDLQASNVIQPIIDLTPTAEGSVLPYELQTAQAFGSQTEFSVGNNTVTIINTPGFFNVRGTWAIVGNSPAFENLVFKLEDGTTSKNIYNYRKLTGANLAEFLTGDYNMTFFLQTGESLVIQASTNVNTTGSYRQIADVAGNLVNPVGYQPQ